MVGLGLREGFAEWVRILYLLFLNVYIGNAVFLVLGYYLRFTGKTGGGLASGVWFRLCVYTHSWVCVLGGVIRGWMLEVS